MPDYAKLRAAAEAMLVPHAGAVDDRFFELWKPGVCLEVLAAAEANSGRRKPVIHDDGLFPGVDVQVVLDFKSMRTKQRASITKTVMAGIQREADKARMTLEQALIVCCERNWRSFKAEWLERDRMVSAPGKFNFEGSDRSSDRAAQAASKARHRIVVPNGEVDL
ncbi:MAG TPA: hypothetical protein VGD52_08880 [Pseudoduganella sp.]